jgi:hypothetical protein
MSVRELMAPLNGRQSGNYLRKSFCIQMHSFNILQVSALLWLSCEYESLLSTVLGAESALMVPGGSVISPL